MLKIEIVHRGHQGEPQRIQCDLKQSPCVITAQPGDRMQVLLDGVSVGVSVKSGDLAPRLVRQSKNLGRVF